MIQGNNSVNLGDTLANFEHWAEDQAKISLEKVSAMLRHNRLI